MDATSNQQVNDPIKQAIYQHSIKLNAGRGGYIFDNRDLFLRGELRTVVWDMALRLWDRIAYLNPDVLVTKGFGGVALVLAMATFSHADVLLVREARKGDGLRRLVEGPPPDALPTNARTVFIDDIINGGTTYREAIQATEIEGYQLRYVGVGVLIDFWAESRALRIIGMPVEALYRRHDFGITRQDAKSSLNLRVAWHVPHLNDDIGLDVKSWPRVRDTRLFVGSDDGHFHCFDTATGVELWTHRSENPQPKGNVCVPAFHGDNVIISSYDGTVRALNRLTGVPAWQVKVDRNLHSSPTVTGGTIYIGTEYDKHGGSTRAEWNGLGDIVALDASTGKLRWRTKTGGMVPCTASTAMFVNAVVCGSNDFHLYMLDADFGTVLWKVNTRGEVKGKPLLIHDRIIVLTNTGWIQCFGYDGNLLWQRDIGGAIHAYPLDNFSHTYVVNNRGMGLCVDEEGNVQWMVRLRGPVGWGFTWFYDDRLAALTTGGQLVTIDPHTGERLSSDYLSKLPGMQGVRTFQPVVCGKERLYIATNNRGLIALNYEI